MKHVLDDLNKPGEYVTLTSRKPQGDVVLELDGPGLGTYHITARDGKLTLVKGEAPKITKPKAPRKAVAPKAKAPAKAKVAKVEATEAAVA